MSNFPERPGVYDQRPERFTTTKLIAEMRAFACNNSDFKNGYIHGIGVRASETIDFRTIMLDAVDKVEGEDDSTHKSVLPDEDQYVTSTYVFDADVLPEYIGRALDFHFGIYIEHTNVEVPVYTAVQYYQHLSPQQAVRAVGPVTFQRSLEFTVSTVNRSLGFTESFTYTDSDNDILEIATCGSEEPNYDPMYVIPASDEDGEMGEDDGSNPFGTVLDLTTARQVLSSAASGRLENESIIVQTPRDALVSWSYEKELRGLDSVFRAEDYDTNLILAFGGFRSMVGALRRQAGIS